MICICLNIDCDHDDNHSVRRDTDIGAYLYKYRHEIIDSYKKAVPELMRGDTDIFMRFVIGQALSVIADSLNIADMINFLENHFKADIEKMKKRHRKDEENERK